MLYKDPDPYALAEELSRLEHQVRCSSKDLLRKMRENQASESEKASRYLQQRRIELNDEDAGAIFSDLIEHSKRIGHSPQLATPSGMTVKLQDYQEEGLAMMVQREQWEQSQGSL